MSTARSDPVAALRRRLPASVTAGHVLFAVVVLVWAVLYLRGLGDLSIRVWDESRYATPARIVAEGGSWLDPKIRVPTHDEQLGEQLRLNKPPLGYWLQAAAMTVLGVSEFAARLPSALATLGCSAIVYHVATRTFDRRAGFAGALLFLAFPGMLLGSHGGKAAVVDPILAFVGSCFVWLTWRGRERPVLLVPAGIVAGLAVMTKGFAAGVFVIVLLPVGVLYLREFLHRWTAAAVVSTVAVALPWHLYAYVEHGDRFVEEYLLTSVASRVQGEATEPPAEPIVPFFNYPWLREAIDLFVPPYQYALPIFGTALIIALGYAWWLVRHERGPSRPTVLLLLWWFVAVPLTFVLGGGNHPWYFMPMYVPGAILLGALVAAVADGSFGDAVDDAVAGTRFGDGNRGFTRLRARLPSPRRARTAVGRRWGETAGRSLYPAVCLLLVVALLGTYGAPLHEPYNDEQRAIGTTMADEVPEDETVHVWLGEDGHQRSIMTVDYYANRPLERSTPSEIAADRSIRFAIIPHGERDRIDRPQRVVAEGPENEITVVEFLDSENAGS